MQEENQAPADDAVATPVTPGADSTVPSDEEAAPVAAPVEGGDDAPAGDAPVEVPAEGDKEEVGDGEAVDDDDQPAAPAAPTV